MRKAQITLKNKTENNRKKYTESGGVVSQLGGFSPTPTPSPPN